MPAKAGIQNKLKTLDSRLRGNDVKGRFKIFYEPIIFGKRRKFGLIRKDAGGGVNIRKSRALMQFQVIFYPAHQGVQIFNMHVFSAGFQDTLFF
mgnify:CR=1 FL=1